MTEIGKIVGAVRSETEVTLQVISSIDGDNVGISFEAYAVGDPKFGWAIGQAALLDASAKVPPPPDPLEIARAGMVCSRLQGRLTLGPDVVARLDAIAANPAESWALRETITNAAEWHRNSQTMDAMGWAMGFTAEQMDALFEAAMKVVP